MASDVDICNFALMKLGHSAIVSLIDDSDEARACNAAYAIVRDDVLAAYPWNFATSWYALSLLVDEPTNPAYAFAYQLPTNTLKVWGLDSQWAYEVQMGQLFTNLDSPIAQITKRITDAGSFSALFTTALGYRLAAEMCDSIVARHTTANDLMIAYERKLQEARTSDGQEGSPLVEDVNDILISRVITN